MDLRKNVGADQRRVQPVLLRMQSVHNQRELMGLCFPQEEVQQEQERLREENINIQKRSEHLLSIMQQFRGM